VGVRSARPQRREVTGQNTREQPLRQGSGPGSRDCAPSRTNEKRLLAALNTQAGGGSLQPTHATLNLSGNCSDESEPLSSPTRIKHPRTSGGTTLSNCRVNENSATGFSRWQSSAMPSPSATSRRTASTSGPQAAGQYTDQHRVERLDRPASGDFGRAVPRHGYGRRSLQRRDLHDFDPEGRRQRHLRDAHLDSHGRVGWQHHRLDADERHPASRVVRRLRERPRGQLRDDCHGEQRQLRDRRGHDVAVAQQRSVQVRPVRSGSQLYVVMHDVRMGAVIGLFDLGEPERAASRGGGSPRSAWSPTLGCLHFTVRFAYSILQQGERSLSKSFFLRHPRCGGDSARWSQAALGPKRPRAVSCDSILPGGPGGDPPGLPQIRTCGFPASGSSGQPFARTGRPVRPSACDRKHCYPSSLR